MATNIVTYIYNLSAPLINQLMDFFYPIGQPTLDFVGELKDYEVYIDKGAMLNPAAYPKLFKVFGTKYGGDGVTTFGTPNAQNRALWGSDGTFGTIEAALPNITGTFVGGTYVPSSYTGAFYVEGETTATQQGSSYREQRVAFSASLSSSVYKSGTTTVQPRAIKVRIKTRYK